MIKFNKVDEFWPPEYAIAILLWLLLLFIWVVVSLYFPNIILILCKQWWIKHDLIHEDKSLNYLHKDGSSFLINTDDCDWHLIQ